MTDLPRHTAGQKGSKPPAKKAIARRKTIPYEQRLPLLTSTNLEVPSTSVVNITTSSGNWSWNWDGVPPPIVSPYSQPYSNWCSPLYPPSPYNQPRLTPFTDITNYYLSPPYLCSQRSNSYSSNSLNGTSSNSDIHGGSEPFIVKILNGRIKVCAGCKGPHLKSADNKPLSPPLDICLGHQEPLLH